MEELGISVDMNVYLQSIGLPSIKLVRPSPRVAAEKHVKIERKRHHQ